MSKENEIIHVIFCQGGMLEFSRTGVYPQYLEFYSELHNNTWTHKVKGDSKTGTLRKGGKVLYRYSFSQEGCNVYDENNNKIDISMSHMMCD